MSTKGTGLEKGLSHFDEAGNARMVDVGLKPETRRLATAAGAINLSEHAYNLVRAGGMAKGDVLGVARIAGIMAAKNVGGIIPLTHPLALDMVKVDFRFSDPCTIEIEARAAITGRTGVEMEALTAVSVAALTIYDMCKAIDKGMTINNIRLLSKTGGKSGGFIRDRLDGDK